MKARCSTCWIDLAKQLKEKALMKRKIKRSNQSQPTNRPSGSVLSNSRKCRKEPSGRQKRKSDKSGRRTSPGLRIKNPSVLRALTEVQKAVMIRPDFTAFIYQAFVLLNPTTKFLYNWHIGVIA